MAKNVAVIGAGPMGLTCAYELLKRGYHVDVYEKEDVIGGMSAHFDFSGLDIEKYYHFVCGPDYPLFNLMKELEIFGTLKWTDTKMGLFYQGELYRWGGPFELLAFPKANIAEKARYGFHVFLASKRNNWKKLDNTTAIDWITGWEGETGYNKFWDSLFHLKFYELKGTIAAPWLWSRLRRVAKSRKNIFQERMGFIEGGSRVVLDKLQEKIIEMGGRVFTGTPVEEILFEENKVIGVKVMGRDQSYNKVISTIPLQYIRNIAPNLPKADTDRLSRLDNVGVVCIIAKMKEKLTDNFWLNIADKDMDIPGMIEISNLNTTLKSNILYVPFYLHKDNPKYSDPDQSFIDKVRAYSKRIKPKLKDEDILDIRVFRYEYAQPVCTVDFLSKLPPIQSNEREGFYFADTAYSYPEDRSITESIQVANNIVKMVERSNEMQCL